MKMIDDHELSDIVKKLINIVKYHKIESPADLKKYVYTHNFSEEVMKLMKQIFDEYGEINVLNSVLSYYSIKKGNTEKNLVKKIKGMKI